MVSVDAIDAWRSAQSSERALLEFAGLAPDLIANAVHTAYCDFDSPAKRAAAELAVLIWFHATTAILDKLRADCPSIAELELLPDKIVRIRSIYSSQGMVNRKSRNWTE